MYVYVYMYMCYITYSETISDRATKRARMTHEGKRCIILSNGVQLQATFLLQTLEDKTSSRVRLNGNIIIIPTSTITMVTLDSP